MNKIAYGALLATLLSGSSFAQELSTPVIYDVSGLDWSGIYVGAQAGYAFGAGTVHIPGYPSTFNVDVNGLSGGLHLGTTAQFGQFVIGVELAGNWMGANGRALSGGTGAEEYVIRQNWEGSLVGRVGFAADRFLVYGLGGGAVTSMTTNYDPVFVTDSSDTVLGWTAGVGAEYAITDNVSAGLEYRFTDFGVGDFVHGGSSTVDLGSHAIKARLSYYF